MCTYTMPSLPLIFVQFLGFISFTKFIISFSRYSYAYFFRSARNLHQFGSWAVITGSTDGIGKSIAFELARKNLNLVLIGRSPQKLIAVSAEINDKYKNVQVKNVVIDLSKDLKQGMKLLSKEIEELDVGILVNSAGVVNEIPRYFDEEGIEVWMEMIKVNLEASTMAILVVLKKMLVNKRGLILNVGSASTFCFPSFPLFDVYAASKGYIAQLTRSLRVEYRSKGIIMQCQFPLSVNTKMLTEVMKYRWFSFFIAPAKSHAQASINWMGHDQEFIPYFPHFLQCFLLNLLPNYVANFIMLHESLALRKASEHNAKKAQAN